MKYLALFLAAGLLFSCENTSAPAPYGPLPSEAHLAWQAMEMNMFVHFNMNTFTNMEWGYGDEPPSRFNPSQLDCRQWARIAKAAGMKGIILTAKHHDGFCLWPTAYTEHSVKNSPWKNGQGNVVRELADACREYNLKLGLYLSPWDRNHADYGTDKYITAFRGQLRELLTDYGDVFEVWFDGANGGDGYYGGANEDRKVDRKTYYDWPTNYAIVDSLMPNALIFSDGGPGVRWVGNEEGWANETNWSILRRDEVWPGYPHYQELRSGHEDGTHWVPAECDVSIRPGWYYHPYEDHKVRPLTEMVDIYYHSVGRNGLLLLNFPVDQRGLIHPADSARIIELADVIRRDFATDLAKGKKVETSTARGGSSKFGGNNITDANTETYWTTDDGVTSASLTIDLGGETEFNRVVLQEYIRLGQRVDSFTVDAKEGGEWKTLANQTTIGYKRILRLPNTLATHVRITIVSAKACPLISNVGIYHAPQLLVEPEISRDKAGMITLKVPEAETEVYYTLDGTAPTPSSVRYSAPFSLTSPTELKAIAYDPGSKKSSAVSSVRMDIAKSNWKVVSVSSGDISTAEKMIDDSPASWWSSEKSQKQPQEVVIDLGEAYTITGATYLPMQDRWIAGVVTKYEWYLSTDGKNWSKPVAEGEFSNIKNNPILQEVNFEAKQARFVKFRSLAAAEDDPTMAVAEIGVKTNP
ncbi:MAG: alpha-L-fucosidase [Bacteroidia bacterium]